METVYIETTIVSYLVADFSRHLLMAAEQQATRDWWSRRRGSFQCVTSDETLAEVLTWNCRHLANAQILRRLSREAVRYGWKLPTVCTPLELMGDDPNALESDS